MNNNKINIMKKDEINCITTIIDFIRKNYSKDHSVQEYADLCNYNKYYFIRLFREYTKETPYRFKTKIRIEKAKELMQNTSMNNIKIAESVGYSSAYYFSRIFKTYTGVSPDTYRKNLEK